MAAEDRRAELRADLLSIFRAALDAADPARAVREALAVRSGAIEVAGRTIGFSPARVRAVAFGKAACAMAREAAEVLSPALFPGPGVAVTSSGSGRQVPRFHVLEAGHPLPDARGVEAARAAVQALSASGEGDLALVLISGGGSALLPAPAPGLSLEDKVETTRLLLAAGADIGELNTVRKHLSALKGGGLARAAQPARVLALILSDVIGDDLSVIASGPVSPDPSTFAGALEVLRRRQVLDQTPAAVRRRLLAGARGEVAETPKPGDPLFRRVQCEVVGSNARSLEAARARARALGYRAAALPRPLLGEARAAPPRIISRARREAARAGGTERIAVLAGGETTVTVRGPGRGGRNQELALALLLQAEGLPAGWDWAFLSAGTDGIDGPTDAAGAIVDAASLARMASSGVDPRSALERNDSHAALEASGDLVRTGPTGTNVADLQVLLLWRRQKPPG